jgi:hypothetical protein
MIYEKGKKYRVVKEGGRLWGMKSTAPYCQTGWGKNLSVGEIITCAGSSMTMGDGVPAMKWLDENGEYLANDCLFSPVQGGMWGGQLPEDGFLEEI